MRRQKERDVPFVIDTNGGKRSPQILRVRPPVFVRLIERLDHPIVAHQNWPAGGHIYTVQCGVFAVQTLSPEILEPVDGSDYRVEEMPTEMQTRPKELEMCIPERSDEAETGVVKRTEPLMELETEDGLLVTEWWNTPADPALSVARMRIEPGVSTKPYQLHGITERYLFLSGNGFVEIDGEVHAVGPGDGILVKPGAWRSVTNKGMRNLGWLAICRPRFDRVDPNLDKTKFVRKG